jgi:hypothetical protein
MGQPQARTPSAAMARSGLFEGFEHQPHFFCSDPRSGVLYPNHQQCSVLLDRFHLYAQADFTRLGELHSVAEQIDQHLAQFQFIGDQVPWRLVEPIRDEAQVPVSCSRLKHCLQIAKQGMQIEGCRVQYSPTGLDLRKHQNIVDEFQQVIPIVMDNLQTLSLFGRYLRVSLHQLGEADDRVYYIGECGSE